MKMIEVAKLCGADCIKFQLHFPEYEMLDVVPPSSNFEKPLKKILEETHFTVEQHKELMEHCKNVGIQYLCTAYCREAADELNKIGVDVFKIGSGEMTNIPLLKHIAKFNKPIIISTGMSTLEEVKETVNAMKGAQIMITHCTSEYPPVYGDINLRMVPKYKEMFKIPVGHSDHTPSIYTALGSVCFGSNMIEKHFTLSRNQEGPDHPVSIEPMELTELVKGVRILEEAMGETKEVFPSEKHIREWAFHSVVSIKDIKAGDLLSLDNVWVKRPGTGIPAKRLDEVIGKRAKQYIPKNELINWEEIA
jgi:N-acetylneuraminate synthase